MPKIAACLICKNSKESIREAISSIRPHVDEINVYDTGSTDGTQEILRRLNDKSLLWLNLETGREVRQPRARKDGSVPAKYAAVPLAPVRVEQGEWRDDFAWAREQSFKMASADADWFFWMDDDDVILGAEHLRSLAYGANPHIDGFVFYYDYARDETGTTICQLWRERLLRRTGEGHWLNPVHEVWLPHGENGPANFVTVPHQQVRFVHNRPPDRYTPTRNLEILQALEQRKRAAGEDIDPRTKAYLGTELSAHGRFAEAIPYLEDYLNDPRTAVGGDERQQIYHRLAVALRMLGHVDASIECEFRALRERDDWTENLVGLCDAFAAAGQPQRAIEWGERALKLGMPQSPLILNPLEHYFLPRVRIAESAAALGEFDKAREHLGEAAKLRPADPAVQAMAHNLEVTASRRRVIDAVLTLRETLVRHDENLKAHQLMQLAVPYIVEDDPLIVANRAMQAENVWHATHPEEYKRWYEDEPKESTVEDEHVPILGDSLERAGFTLELAQRFEAEHGYKPKILDLGCNDAWMACFLWLKGEYHVDGIELNKATVEKGLARLERFGAPGTIVQGDILDAVELLGARNKVGGLYDIVTCYEVYEHVPDTERLLAVMEELLSVVGVACVTTPAGAFEEGNLPFWQIVERKGHLRAVTPKQLAAELLPRGELVDFRIHQNDKLSWAAWRPKRKKGKVALVAPGSWEPWKPTDILERGLGGSETALSYLALELAARDYQVEVFADTQPVDVVGQSLWHPGGAFDPTVERQAVIVSRAPQMFGVEIHAPVRVLWCHDHTYPLEEEACRRITHVATLSEWQRNRFRRLFPWLSERLVIMRNGIPWYDAQGTRFPDAARTFAEREPTCIYSSSADRGLDTLLEVWPEIRARVPDAKLRIFYGWDVYDRVAAFQPGLAEYKQKVMGLAADAGGEEGGVLFEGRQGQRVLYAAMQAARVWSYPTAFLETSCIGAMEAQAAGLPIVTSKLGALKETAAGQYLVPWNAPEDEPYNTGKEYRREFVEAVVTLLTDEQTWQAQHLGGLRGAEQRDWRRRVDEWVNLIEGSHDGLNGNGEAAAGVLADARPALAVQPR